VPAALLGGCDDEGAVFEAGQIGVAEEVEVGVRVLGGDLEVSGGGTLGLGIRALEWLE
jgi:hypothetical protein